MASHMVADLPRPALVQRNREQRLVLARAQPGLDEPHDRGCGSTALDDDAAPQPLELPVRSGTPRTRAWYSRSTSWLGWSRRAASSPSLVSSSRPSES